MSRTEAGKERIGEGDNAYDSEGVESSADCDCVASNMARFDFEIMSEDIDGVARTRLQ